MQWIKVDGRVEYSNVAMNPISKTKSDDFGDPVRLSPKRLLEIVLSSLNNGRVSHLLRMGGWLVHNGESKTLCVGQKALVCFMHGQSKACQIKQV